MEQKKQHKNQVIDGIFIRRILFLIIIILLILLLLRSCLSNVSSPNDYDEDPDVEVTPDPNEPDGDLDYTMDILPEYNIYESPWRGIDFEVREGYAVITGSVHDFIVRYFGDYDGVLVLPTTYNGYPIRYIDYRAFAARNLTRINLTRMTYLEVIGEAAFANNNAWDGGLDTLNLSGLNHLRIIGVRAFAQGRMSALLLAGVYALEEIRDRAFENNLLIEIVLDDMPSLIRIETRAFADQSICRSRFRYS